MACPSLYICSFMSPTLFISSNFIPFSLYLFLNLPLSPSSPLPSLYPLILSLPLSMSLTKQSLSHYPTSLPIPLSPLPISLSTPFFVPPSPFPTLYLRPLLPLSLPPSSPISFTPLSFSLLLTLCICLLTVSLPQWMFLYL